MKRRIRAENNVFRTEEIDFKHEMVKDILYQIDYQTALRHNVVSVQEGDMIKELKKLPTNILISWYLAYIFIRRELMRAGYELNGLKVFDKPLDTIHDLMKTDPDFDLRQYIF